MIVEHWYQLTRAIDKAVPCYTPMPRAPYGNEDRCGSCDGCKDYEKVEEALAAVEADIEKEQGRTDGDVQADAIDESGEAQAAGMRPDPSRPQGSD